MFGEKVKLIKLETQTFDASVLFTLLNNLRFDRDYLSRDAEAVEVAIALLRNSSMNGGAKKIFVFTDGYSSSNERLKQALKTADDLDYDTIGVAVGFDKTNVQDAYKMYIHAALPFNFHEALQALYENSSDYGMLG